MSLLPNEPLSIWFHMPAPDPLGRDEVLGKLRFLPDLVELHWRLKGNVFRNADMDMQCIALPYGEIESVEIVKRWWKIRQLILRIGTPTWVNAIPAAEMGKLILHIDERSALDAKKLHSIIDFRRSCFLLDESTKRLQWDATTTPNAP